MVESHVRVTLGCVNGFEAGCQAQPGQIYHLSVKEAGTFWAHKCTNDHYLYEIGVISITDPFTGQQGVDFVVSAGTPLHCQEPSGASGCGGNNIE